ncbi:MAG TPA: Ig-like domain-containing protein [Longimicrobium sp.]|nr:Ig-like domain-containing protein [Longimicrobium sp.]
MNMRLGLLSAAVLLVLTACGGGDGPTDRVVGVASVRVEAPADSVSIGQQLQLSAVALDEAGVAVPGRLLTWSTSSGDVATVSTSGLVSGVAAGNVTITATAGDVTGTVSLRVRPVAPAPIATLAIVPDSSRIEQGGTVQLSVLARDAAGNALAGRPTTLTTSDAAIAGLSGTGLVTGLAPGVAIITATSEGRTATARVVVTQIPAGSVTITPSEAVVFIGATQTLTATVRSAGGTVLAGRTVEWSTSNAAVATVSATGVVTGVAAGSAQVTAAIEGKTHVVPVTVRIPGHDVIDPQLTSFGVQPDSIDVTAGSGSFTFTFTARDFGTGVTSVFVSLNHPTNTGSTKACGGTRVSGNAYEGTYTCTVLFPQNSPARTWNIDYVSVQDVAGNRIQINTPALAAAGWPTSVKVKGAAPDETAPTVASFSFTPETVNVANGPGSVVFTIGGRDLGGTGIISVFVSLNFLNNPGSTRVCSASEPASGTRTDGVFQCTVTFPAQSPSRTWNVDYISLTDAVGNTYRPFQGELQQRGFATTVTVTN